MNAQIKEKNLQAVSIDIEIFCVVVERKIRVREKIKKIIEEAEIICTKCDPNVRLFMDLYVLG
jgi:hypothetical protein